jgi:hypothetical protein
MKVYTNIIIDMVSGNVIESESYDYDGPVALCVSMVAGVEKSSSEPVIVPVWSKGQKALFDAMYPALKEGISGGVNAYPGQMYVPQTAQETQYFNSANDFASQLGGLRANMGQAAYDINPETTEQFYQQSVKAPMMQEWKEIVEPQIRESYVGPGYWGSERARGEQMGAEHLATTLGSERASLAYQDELARRGSLESAAAREAQFGPSTVQQQYGMSANTAEYSRQIEQEKVMADLQRWLMGESVNGVSASQYNPFMQLVFQTLGLQPNVVATSTKSSNLSYSGGIG